MTAELVRPHLPQQVHHLLGVSAHTIVEASVIADPSIRYVTAHVGALRAAAAVIAARAVPKKRSGIASTWTLLTRIAPELSEWAVFFASSAHMRAAAEAGTAHVTDRLADDLVREAQAFREAVCRVLGVPHQEVHL